MPLSWCCRRSPCVYAGRRGKAPEMRLFGDESGERSVAHPIKCTYALRCGARCVNAVPTRGHLRSIFYKAQLPQLTGTVPP
ncbi:hypothetical protein ABB37_02568 [Leptomonas pyrrhocoris]|uniref:Uncharacterized protein n=1 Tax=Leptomonas pyrrhocoris TaxID=157538 RepID=A0A0M9G5U0_LEPPY|nr:hypothetical protein ABB37_02568 [Leptomonas pyrrhocoris]KPA82786.1 hypothetical protein ABB37_02568 [Leptomonas pyrrhocoris]|eukprot:XP_015661225.1 hypothetical protein ABB37_02568 [Leptomonas pyrrhocoris]